jgi:hypothetical protein
LALGIALSSYITYKAKQSIFLQFRAFTYCSNFLGLFSTIIGIETQFAKTIQLSAFLMLATTFFIYHTIMPKFQNFETYIGKMVDLIQHGIGPICFGIWFIFSFRYQLTLSIILLAIIIPNIWSISTLYRENKGEDSGYPFLRITVLGVKKVSLYLGLINAINITLACLLGYLLK